ncbi:MAG TPA: TetR family transcriptional regulator, partial [Protaetiibacter sp.]|nr:TetR family transcriptional regulator [Protaetiibacter sp.]
MRSASASPGPDDLTATARIRDAAVRLFGERGYDRTSVRDIATAAGVSPALVIHHFGSKGALRAECDRWMLAQLGEKRTDALGAQAGATIQRWLADPEQFRPLVDYLAVMLTDDGEHGRRVFDMLLAETRAMLDASVADGTMRPSSDPEARALLVTLHGIAPVILRGHLERALGGDILSSAVLARLTLPSLELYTDGLYTDSTLLDAARAAIGAQKEQR